MKNIKYIILVIVSVFASCNEDYLELKNPNAIDSTQFFQDADDIESAVTGIYSELRAFPEIFNINLSEVRSNNISFGISNAQRDPVDISRFNVTQVMNTIEDAWQSGYIVISRANKVLEVIEELQLDNEELNTKIEGEARFLRAYAHFNLAKVFRRIPIVKETLSPDEGTQLGQSELEEVYKFIEEDLLIAVEKLAVNYPDEAGRATKGAAQALLGELYLTWGSFPIKDNSKLDLAISLFENLISKKGTPTFNWANNYSELFKSENDNKYSIFEIQYISGTAGIGAVFPSLFLSSNFLEFPFSGGVPQIRPSENLIDSFDKENDSRYNISVDTIYTNNFFLQQQDNYIKKWFQKDKISSMLSRLDWPHNYPIIRPASIYIMHAEALNLKNNGPNQQAVNSLNELRKRAGLNDINPAATKEEFLQALKQEYRSEFVGEGLYWHFLIRSELAVNEMNTWFSSINENITVTENKLIYPIPFSQMNIKKGLYQQNPGY
tara:strand:+ start:15829 stop:17310 length:1482 start_codon:yes stop_codon:yes gene_type:complete